MSHASLREALRRLLATSSAILALGTRPSLPVAYAQGAQEEASAVPGQPEWSLREIRIRNEEDVLGRGFLLTPPDDRPAHAVSEEVGEQVKSGALDPEKAYLSSIPATKVGRDGKPIAEKSEDKSNTSGDTSSGTAIAKDCVFPKNASEDPMPESHLSTQASDKQFPTQAPPIPSGNEPLDVPSFSAWKLQRVTTDDESKGEVFSLKPPDDRPAGRISGPIASRLFGGDLSAEMAYRTAALPSRHTAPGRGQSSLSTAGTSGSGTTAAAAAMSTPRTPASANEVADNVAQSSNSPAAGVEKSPSVKDAPSSTSSTSTATSTMAIRIGNSNGAMRSARRCQPREATTTTKRATEKPPQQPAPPPKAVSNKTIQGISDIWMDQPGSHRSTVTPMQNCPRGYSAHPYYDDGSGLGGIIGDVGYNGFMGGGVFFCMVTDPDADSIVTDVVVTPSKAKADPCPGGYESRKLIADCQQGFGAACAVPVLLQNLCVKKEPVASAKVAVTDFGVTPTINAGLAHQSDIPCPDGYKTVGETTSCGGAAAYCSGKQSFCMKVNKIADAVPERKDPQATSTGTAVTTSTTTPEVVCLDDDSNLGPGQVPRGESENPESDITGTDKKNSQR